MQGDAFTFAANASGIDQAKSPRMVSANGEYTMIMQDDGHLCVYRTNGDPFPRDFVWGADTATTLARPYSLQIQQFDANMAVYDGKGGCVYARPGQNGGKAPFTLTLQDTGVVEYHDSDGKLWWTSADPNVPGWQRL